MIFAVVSLGGIALAGVLGWFVSRAAVAPVERLRRAAEQVATTRDLSRRIETTGNDELTALAGSFNQMLNALESSLNAQRQLVADASHELRTPLASLRTNIEVLTHADLIDEEERRALLADVVSQLEELTALVVDLVDLARESEPEHEPPTVIRFDLVVANAIDRARSHAATASFELDASPTSVRAVEGRIERAVSNLLDNAVKWSPPGGRIEVRVPTASSRSATTARGSPTRTRSRLRPLLPLDAGPRAARIGARAGDRPPGRGDRRWHGDRRERARRGRAARVPPACGRRAGPGPPPA